MAELEKTGAWPGWTKAFEMFKERHPDQRYASLQSFRQAVYDLRKRRRDKSGS